MTDWFTFAYNDAMIEYIKKTQYTYPVDYTFAKHLECVTWLDNNLDNSDYNFNGNFRKRAAITKNGVPCIVVENIMFKNEQDMLAFKLATGL